jgi:single stranded DNA-binding protein
MITSRIFGRLTKDPIAETPKNGGDEYVRFTVASNAGRKDRASMFVDITVFGKQGGVIRQYFHKGSRIVVDVRDMEAQGWTGNDGTPRASLHAIMTSFEFVDTRAENESQPAPQQGYAQTPAAQQGYNQSPAYGQPPVQQQAYTQPPLGYAQPAQQPAQQPPTAPPAGIPWTGR